MKNRWRDIVVIIVIACLWRIALGVVEYITSVYIPRNPQFLESVPWANFDGGHYLSIASGGYHIYQQAYFPLYPLIIRFFSSIFHISTAISALIISHTSFIIGIILFYEIAIIERIRHSLLVVIFLLLFPTSFFFVSAYNESLYFALACGLIYALKRKQWLIAGLLGLLASATRLFGIFLIIFPIFEFASLQKEKRGFLHVLSIVLIPCGFILYLLFLWRTEGDPFAFFHVLPAFGEQRGSGSIILLPQVVWRYIKIFFSASPWTLQYGVAVLEMMMFLFGATLIFVGWKQSIKKQYLIYSFFVLMLSSFTGTFSSLPRYFLSAFPLFFMLGNMHNMWMKIVVSAFFAIGLIISTALFLSGYFIA